MKLQKYQHIERYGYDKIKELTHGECYIFPKIDGTNGSIWFEDGEVRCGSRNRILTSAENDNQGFWLWVQQQDNIKEYILSHKDNILYGEWLVPHTIQSYRDEAWRKFYVFDVRNKYTGEYIHYDLYKCDLDLYNIEYIKPMCVIDCPTKEQLYSKLELNDYLMRDGYIGEGIVIKNYRFKTMGKQTWGKIVRTEFKDKHRDMSDVSIQSGLSIESKVIDKFVTNALCEKEMAKIRNETGTFENRDMPRLLSTIFYCIITEDMWDILKKFKNPTIDFAKLKYYCNNKVRTFLEL